MKTFTLLAIAVAALLISNNAEAQVSRGPNGELILRNPGGTTTTILPSFGTWRQPLGPVQPFDNGQYKGFLQPTTNGQSGYLVDPSGSSFLINNPESKSNIPNPGPALPNNSRYSQQQRPNNNRGPATPNNSHSSQQLWHNNGSRR